ncbi:MAG: ribonuclease, Rne/Rng family [Hyphomicrobiales bacterium]|nr:ribonuclease, Rne/Rng family [Hyphomicrobiales bacterium]
MANKMLIDATHPEETRVVVLRGNRVEEFDFEAANRKQLRGNIYLAKVTRVEPSLQAAFIEYGGNRHGFLAFSEIHPDYYQIPVADRLALLEEEARQHRDEDDDDGKQRRSRRRQRPEKRARSEASVSEVATLEDGVESNEPPRNLDESDEAQQQDGETSEGTQRIETSASEAPSFNDDQVPSEVQPVHDEHHHEILAVDPQGYATVEGDDDSAMTEGQESSEDIEPSDVSAPRAERSEAGSDDDHHDDEEHEEEHVEHIGGDAMEELPNRVVRLRRQYKIQEVIKRRQVLLVQVVKEERGNKGAALTTYLSLAGRYSVLMPNTARGGGISRKITDAADRKRLKAVAQELEVPEGMGVILRTAGASRTKPEIKRDFEYLLRMWETVRELTLKSSAPNLVYEEGSLIKRAIRDLYNKDIDEVTVAGEEGYREAKEFMRMLMPSHAKNVQPYRDPQPIFAKAGAEAQLDAMFSNHVTLKSGGYIVINQTEALVAIDVNSGRSTREHNIEDTAVRTNLEAADEVARQLRLRDLAGLIVVDFIDMEENRNNRSVERRIKDALKNDRARIQVGRISHFGLLEMSRQRIRTGVLEGSTVVCSHCAGAGMVRGTSSIALHVMRVLEDALIKSSMHNITVRTRTEVALYILNQKRPHLHSLEERFGVVITVESDDTLTGMTYHALERGELASPPVGFEKKEMVRIDSVPIADEEFEPEVEDEEEDEEEAAAPVAARSEPERGGRQPQAERNAPRPESEDANSEEGRRKRRRRRRRGRGGDREGSSIEANAPQPSDDMLAIVAEIGGDMARRAESLQSDGEVDNAEAEAFEVEGASQGEPEGLRRRRRSRRGGRNRRRDGSEIAGREGIPPGVEASSEAPEPVASESVSEPAPKPYESRTYEPASSEPVASEPPVAPAWDWSPVQAAAAPSPAPVDAEPKAEPAPQPKPEPAAVVAAPEPIAASAPVETPAPEAVAQPAPREDIPTAPVGPKRSGWWQRAKQTLSGH